MLVWGSVTQETDGPRKPLMSPALGPAPREPRKHPGSVSAPPTAAGSPAFSRETKAFGSGPRGQAVSYALGLHTSPGPGGSLGEIFPERQVGD